MVVVDAPETSRLYQDARQRITGLVSGDAEAWSVRTAACPDWTVRDVVAHLVAVAEDWASGRLTGPPTDAETAAQIARFNGFDEAAILAAWTDAAAELDRLAQTAALTAPLGDITAHEHDVRGAIGRPGARGSEAVWHSTDQLLANLRTPVPLRVTVEDGQYRSGPEDRTELVLHTSRFEALRWRTGRRSRSQLAAMDWSDDPAPILDHLYIFGPTDADIVE